MDTHTHTNDSTHPAILQRPVFAETHTYTHECTTHLFSTLAFADTHTHTQRPVTHTHTHTHTHARTNAARHSLASVPVEHYFSRARRRVGEGGGGQHQQTNRQTVTGRPGVVHLFF